MADDSLAAMTLNTTFDVPDLLDSSPPEESAPPRQRVPLLFKLAHGYVRFKRGASYTERQLYWQKLKMNPKLKDKLAKPPSDCWLFTNKQFLGKSIQLYASQVGKLVELLPEAYDALLAKDTTYFEIVSESKTLRLTLEVGYYKFKEQDMIQLALKKSYKPEDKADDEDQDWLPTSSHIKFDPERDEPEALLEYILATSES